MIYFNCTISFRTGWCVQPAPKHPSSVPVHSSNRYRRSFRYWLRQPIVMPNAFRHHYHFGCAGISIGIEAGCQPVGVCRTRTDTPLGFLKPVVLSLSKVKHFEH